MRLTFPRVALFPCLLFARLAAYASFVNVTIDDTYGDPSTGAQIVYTPTGAWKSGTEHCDSCPSPLEFSNNSYHYALFERTIPTDHRIATVMFNGQYLAAC